MWKEVPLARHLNTESPCHQLTLARGTQAGSPYRQLPRRAFSPVTLRFPHFASDARTC